MSSNNDARPDAGERRSGRRRATEAAATGAPDTGSISSVAKMVVRDLVIMRGGRTVLTVPAFDIPAAQVTAVIGPNGSGKSTLLGALQLLIRPSRGDLFLDGEPMWDRPLATRRRMASAFQDPLLLNTSVMKNLETALGLRKVPRRDRRPRAAHWLARLGVRHLADRHAGDISGGEAQRVSLARAFSLQPEVLLLDEPFAALDAPTRDALIDDVANIVRETRLTTVFVTHDRDEALRLADRVAVLIDGAVRQVGTPDAVFGAPIDEEVAAFVGVENVWPSELCETREGVATYRVGRCRLEVATDRPARRALFCIRPEEITVYTAQDGPTGSARNRLQGLVRSIHPAGPIVRLRMVLDGDSGDPPIDLVATITRPSLEALGLEVGTHVVATFKATAAHVIPHPSAGTSI